MCGIKFYMTLAVIASAAATPQQQQWNPVYSQHARSDEYTLQMPQQYDQQLQATDYSNYESGSHQGLDSYGVSQDGGGGHDFSAVSDSGGHNFGGHDFGGHDFKAHSYPVHEHVEEDNPEPIKHYKEVVVPIPKNVEFKVPVPVLIPVPHPVPIQVPVPKAVVIPIIKEVTIPVEKSRPYPVEKTVHVPKFKDVPFNVYKHVIVVVEKPVPFKVPVYETIIHTKKGSHKI